MKDMLYLFAFEMLFAAMMLSPLLYAWLLQ